MADGSAGRLGDPAATAPAVPLRRGLTLRLGLIALAVALLVSLLGGALELSMTLRAERAAAVTTLDRTVALVRDSAAEAAFQLNPGVARRVIEGLSAIDTVIHAEVRDNFGGVLGRLERPDPPAPGPDAWFASLFADVTRRQVALEYTGGGDPEVVGRLTVVLSDAALGARYRDHALASLAGGALRALVIAALLAAALAVLVIQPMRRLSVGIGRVDPARPGARPVPVPRGHRRDELGHVAVALNGLLGAFQDSLDGRDRAEAELRALTAELEERVAQRTRALADAMDELAAEKEETDSAFARLDEAHRDLERANRLVLESIQYARRIQTSLLPDKRALDGRVRDLHVCWEPLDVVGGDYFWLERCADGSALLVVVDCTGHGVPGAFMTLVVASELDRILHDQGLRRPSDILRALDRQVRARLRQDRPDSDSDDGLEAAVCLWEPGPATLTFSGAGLPLLYVEDGALHEVRGDRAWLGYRTLPAAESFTDHVVTVRPGMAFYMITDGVPDHMGGEPRRLLGRRRLGRIMLGNQGRPMAEQLAALRRDLESWRGAEPRRDDMTMIGFVPL
ncbi:SpoIIE family protein phosphatase [Roseospira goensis]|uniref:Serine phosphatase RsbU (Regulator of sigma subunit) n=1 Tax=Roseospira goensis TaxID=391922 RepID=A0A7W6S0I7_9PROT|nr:SpoIIE family protein phosphatase [Roseospira goensis]MBB4286135.1 serine phosphatase RsbU (regulator of sigma subunit) [Roseospira goensis]